MRLRRWAALVFCLCAAASTARAEDAPQVNLKRPFDAFSGVVYACLPAPAIPWTSAACKDLDAEMVQRAKAAAIKLVILPVGETSFERAGDQAGLDGAKAIQMVLRFNLFGDQRNRVSLDLMSHWMWRPTQKDIPSVAPGQQFPRNFLTTSAQSTENVTSDQFAPYSKQLIGLFFDVGEGRT